MSIRKGLPYPFGIIFSPDGVTKYAEGEVFDVEVSGLRNNAGIPATLRYSTHFVKELPGLPSPTPTPTPTPTPNPTPKPGPDSGKDSGGGGCDAGLGGLALLLAASRVLKKKA